MSERTTFVQSVLLNSAEIDEIDNLGAAKNRLRSLKEAIAQKKGV